MRISESVARNIMKSLDQNMQQRLKNVNQKFIYVQNLCYMPQKSRAFGANIRKLILLIQTAKHAIENIFFVDKAKSRKYMQHPQGGSIAYSKGLRLTTPLATYVSSPLRGGGIPPGYATARNTNVTLAHRRRTQKFVTLVARFKLIRQAKSF